MPKLTDKVSIITPSYNSSKYISQTIESVLSQSYNNWEMIIVDDVSLDNSNEIIEEYIKKDSRIRLIKLEHNSGPAFARNRAIKESEGRYIAFLDSDDVWFPTKLEKQLDFMATNGLSITYSSYDTIDRNGEIINTRNAKENITYNDMLKSNFIGNLTGIYDASKIGKIFMDSIGHEDYVLWLAIMKKVKKTRGIVEPLAGYRILPSSISANKFKALQWQWNIYRKTEKLNIFASAYYFSWYIYFALKKRR